ncbi:MAG TPA: LpxD N-terminal domain-containing protein, partial [Caldimonas sp.]
MADVALGEISERLGGELIGDAATRIDRVGPLESATPSTIAFLANPQYEKQLATSRAACVIVAPAFRDAALARGAAIVTPDPYLYFARLTQWWAGRIRPGRVPGVHATAVVDPAAVLAVDVAIGAFVVVEAGVTIAAGVSIGAHSFVGRDCRVGAGTR